MSKAPAFQLYAADFFMDTVEWSVDEVGIYWRLLQSQWINGDLPSDINRLARIAGCGVKKFQKGWGIIEKKFNLNGDGRLQNQKLEIVREQQHKYKETQAEKGKKGAKTRWEDDGRSYNTGISKANGKGNGRKIALQSSSSKDIKKEEEMQTPFVFCEIPLKDNTQFEITEEKVKEYEVTYPNITIRQEIMKLRQWNIDNPLNRKTRRYFLKHVNSWLGGSQKDKGYITQAPTYEQHEKDNRTPEQKIRDMQKFKEFSGDLEGKLKEID